VRSDKINFVEKEKSGGGQERQGQGRKKQEYCTILSQEGRNKERKGSLIKLKDIKITRKILIKRNK
jgi:hypothetical protein